MSKTTTVFIHRNKPYRMTKHRKGLDALVPKKP